MKNHPVNNGAQESIINVEAAGYNCEVSTITRNSVDFMKLSKYSGLGHADYPVRNDPAILTWLFSNSLDKR